MKTTLSVAFVCLALAATGLAAAKKSKKKPAGHSTLPPTSPMIVIPPVPEAAAKPPGTDGLITTELNGKDLQFFTTALQAGRIQAYLVDQIKTKGESESIKAVGSALATTQGEENKQIAQLASLKGLAVPTDPPDDLQKIAADLEKVSGSNFDKAAMDGIISAGRQSMAAYETAAQSSDGDIKAFSEQMLPIAKEKLRLTEKMTGAGSKAAGQLFRTGAPPKATPSGTPAKPAASPVKPAASPAKPVASPAKPVASPAKPAASPAKPATPTATPTAPPITTPKASPAKPVKTTATPPPLTIKQPTIATPAPSSAVTPPRASTPAALEPP